MPSIRNNHQLNLARLPRLPEPFLDLAPHILHGDGVADDELLNDARVRRGEEDARGGAHGHADPGPQFWDPQGVEQVGDVLDHGVEGRGGEVGGRGGVAVARLVVAEGAEPGVVEDGDDVVPYGDVGAQGVGEEDYGGVLGRVVQQRQTMEGMERLCEV
ncbi:unnamed protein product [Clonostachys rosea f. rosea IK726]|uniref:Uncharacterized protein n=1 Tax=Clonostachys rosea f. rosea IK726 TaxID=1349383 RepID=A0ACA9U2C3_BIOOC|nr:unnamed protein product [Clonostachys rosea f. rosea IK726]